MVGVRVGVILVEIDGVIVGVIVGVALNKSPISGLVFVGVMVIVNDGVDVIDGVTVCVADTFGGVRLLVTVRVTFGVFVTVLVGVGLFLGALFISHKCILELFINN